MKKPCLPKFFGKGRWAKTAGSKIGKGRQRATACLALLKQQSVARSKAVRGATVARLQRIRAKIWENRLGLVYLALVLVMLLVPVSSLHDGAAQQNGQTDSSSEAIKNDGQVPLTDLGLVNLSQEPEPAPPAALKPDKAAATAPSQPSKPKEGQPSQNSPAPAVPKPAENTQLTGLPWPVQGSVVRGFGWSKDPVYNDYRLHSGLDIAAPAGSAIQTVLDGTVKEVAEDPVLGKVITIDHGGKQTRYAHCETVKVKPGERVTTGRTIATVGRSGIAARAQLHFEIWVDGKSVEPLSYLAEN